VVGVVAMGPRAGRRVLRLGADPGAPLVTTSGPRQARLGGFDLHANTAVPARARRRLEKLCRYVLCCRLRLSAQFRRSGRQLQLSADLMQQSREQALGVLVRWYDPSRGAGST